MTAALLDERAAPGTYPIPAGRGRWRFTLHHRDFSGSQSPQQSAIAELPSASARVLTQAWDTAAQLQFNLDGRTAAAALLIELAQDVVAWRWDDTSGFDRPAFRGPITQTQDTINQDSHVVQVTCHDYLSLLSRRLLTQPQTFTSLDQDTIVGDLISLASAVTSTSGTSLAPASYLPLTLTQVNPDGSARAALSGQQRTQTFNASTDVLSILDGLAKQVGGFDYDADSDGYGAAVALRVFYPYQGIQRTDMALIYGSTVSALTRSVDSSTYGNYWRAVGNNGSAATNAPQLVAETWNSDANNISSNPAGLWMSADNQSSVADPVALAAVVQGDLAMYGKLLPSYALTLTPKTYYYGAPSMGDVVPLMIQSGRLDVSTYVRVLGITFTIGDDGNEDVALTVGLPGRSLYQLFTASQQDVNALVRR